MQIKIEIYLVEYFSAVLYVEYKYIFIFPDNVCKFYLSCCIIDIYTKTQKTLKIYTEKSDVNKLPNHRLTRGHK